MFNILIVSHGSVAKSFYETAEMIMGQIEGVRAAGIQPGESSEDFGERLAVLAKELYTDEGLLVLADLYGGTPCNVTIKNLLDEYDKIQLISGFNLPILLEALGSRNFLQLEDITEILIQTGKDGVKNVNKMVNKNNKYDDDE